MLVLVCVLLISSVFSVFHAACCDIVTTVVFAKLKGDHTVKCTFIVLRITAINIFKDLVTYRQLTSWKQLYNTWSSVNLLAKKLVDKEFSYEFERRRKIREF